MRGAVELSGQDYLATVENTANRITLIDTDGTVLYDNQADPATMETTATGRSSKRPPRPAPGKPPAFPTPLPSRPSTTR